MRTEHKILLALSVIVAGTVACQESGNAQVQLAPGDATPTNEIPTLTANKSSSGDLYSPSNADILTEDGRHIAMAATAQSVSEKGVNGLVAEGFPEKVITSHKIITETWMFNVNKNGAIESGAVGFGCGSTAVNVPELNAILLIGITHCFSPNSINVSQTALAQQTNPGASVVVTDSQLFSLQLGNSNLQRSMFGVAFNEDPQMVLSDGTKEGISVVYIPKESLNPGDLQEMESTAISLNDLSFENVPTGSKYYGYCSPGEIDGGSVVLTGSENYAESQVSVVVRPYLAGHQCSGSGMHAQFPNGEVKTTAVLSGKDIGNPQIGDKIIGYRLGALGLNNFMQLVTQAQYDWQNRTGH